MIKGFWIAIGMVALVSSIYYYMEKTGSRHWQRRDWTPSKRNTILAQADG